MNYGAHAMSKRGQWCLAKGNWARQGNGTYIVRPPNGCSAISISSDIVKREPGNRITVTVPIVVSKADDPKGVGYCGQLINGDWYAAQ